LWNSRTSFGSFPVVAGTTQTIPITGMTSTGLVQLTYVHPNTGGAGQFISNIVYNADSITVTLGQAGASTPNQETITWQVLRFS
jgi:hypothetical protein